MKYIIEIPDDILSEVKEITKARIETICGFPMKKLIECKDCRYYVVHNYITDAFPFSLKEGAKVEVSNEYCAKGMNIIFSDGSGFCAWADRK